MQLQTKLAFHARRTALRLFYRGARQRLDLLSLQALQALADGYVPWSGVAMRPAAVAAIVNDIIVNDRRTIVECGGGVSTIFMARALRERPGRLVTFEHDAAWAAMLSKRLRDDGLEDRALVVEAPLAPTDVSPHGHPWYAEDVLSAVEIDGPIDLLVVDGPPAGKPAPHSRYPALRFFADALAPSCTVVLDDVGRPGEQEVVARWERESDLTFDRRYVAGDVAVGHRGRCFVV